MAPSPVTAPGSVVVKRRVEPSDPHRVLELLHQLTGLSKTAIKEAMLKGALWHQQARGGARRRLRRATVELRSGDLVELYYDRELLAREAPPARCLLDRGRYSVWLKPAGMLAQGTSFGDHCSLLRQAELQLKQGQLKQGQLKQGQLKQGQLYLVHRLDRETAGLMLIAHDRQAAAKLSALLRQGLITKRYHARVRGHLAAHHGQEGRIELPLSGKPARTDYEVVRYDADHDYSTVAVLLHTGRMHQIRRHFAALGHPVLGDPRYGRSLLGDPRSGHSSNTEHALQLVASALEWVCPFEHERLLLELNPEELWPARA